jgi:hypothetical protein
VQRSFEVGVQKNTIKVLNRQSLATSPTIFSLSSVQSQAPLMTRVLSASRPAAPLPSNSRDKRAAINSIPVTRWRGKPVHGSQRDSRDDGRRIPVAPGYEYLG